MNIIAKKQVTIKIYLKYLCFYFIILQTLIKPKYKTFLFCQMNSVWTTLTAGQMRLSYPWQSIIVKVRNKNSSATLPLALKRHKSEYGLA